MELIADQLGSPGSKLKAWSPSTLFSDKIKGDVVIRLCGDIIDRHAGGVKSRRSFRRAGYCCRRDLRRRPLLLEQTPFLGMSDQAPLLRMIDQTIVTCLSPRKGSSHLFQPESGCPEPEGLVTAHTGRQQQSSVDQGGSQQQYQACRRSCCARCPPMQDCTQLPAAQPGKFWMNWKSPDLPRGGLDFPTGRKWRVAADIPAHSNDMLSAMRMKESRGHSKTGCC